MKKLILSLFLLSLITQANAQWSDNPAVNNPIVTTSNTTQKSDLVSINDGNNNMIIAWVDSRNSATLGTDIYVQKINNDGSLPWGAEKVVCNAVNNQSAVSITSDGAGGAILAWGDRRSGTSANDEEVYGQRIKSDGSVGWAANGVLLTKAVASSTVYRRKPALVKASTTEFIVVFEQLGTSADYFAQKGLISTGAPQWTSDVSVHGAQASTQAGVTLLADNTGGAFIVWQDPRLANTNADIYGQRITSEGNLAWGASGKIICDASGGQTAPSITSDGAGGFVATWVDFRNLDNDIYAQRVDASGTRMWDVGVSPAVDLNGVGVCVLTSTDNGLKNQGNPKVINDGNNNFIIAWFDPRTDANSLDIYAQKLNISGAAQWTANGVPVIAKENSQGGSGDFTMENAGSGNTFVIYRDVIPKIPATETDPEVPAHNDIYIQRLNSADGGVTTPFTTAGFPVSTNLGSQNGINTITDGSGGVIVAWQDSRNSSNGAIYASRVYANGTLPVTFKTITASLSNEQNVLVKWEIATEVNTKNYVVERATENGVFVAIGGVDASQIGTYQFKDINPLSGNNYYRIKAVDFDGHITLSATAAVKINSLNQTDVAIYPNPVKDVLNIVSNKLVNNELYTVKLFNTSGQLLFSKSADANSTGTISINVASINFGVYTLQLTDAKNNIISTKKIVKH
ncbi:MAG TPA: T9SS type A sorting domain-containing protein [Pelobium sp.]